MSGTPSMAISGAKDGGEVGGLGADDAGDHLGRRGSSPVQHQGDRKASCAKPPKAVRPTSVRVLGQVRLPENAPNAKTVTAARPRAPSVRSLAIGGAKN